MGRGFWWEFHEAKGGKVGLGDFGSESCENGVVFGRRLKEASFTGIWYVERISPPPYAV